ncbi:MAG: isoprenoid biosynthesis protein ElbB [Bacteroidetes bacterium HGW-Bacteroidetes-21]|nr:MAG: isoprenoid biosynthesis protein ElbB [Bacteroidetes bacterium HGW-Bacteroidetes-21]
MAHKNVFAVVLSGCGVYDGAEIQESILVMYAIAKMGADYEVFAPDVLMHDVVNHLTKVKENGSRNVLTESARIARGKVRPLTEYKASAYSGIVFPGGFGVVKNLCTYAFDGVDCKVLPEVEKAIKETAKLGKPIGALCISPVLIAKVLGNVTITIGDNEATVADLEKLGGKHMLTTQTQVVVDPVNKIVTSPCYMLESTIDQIGDGAMNVVREMVKML